MWARENKHFGVTERQAYKKKRLEGERPFKITRGGGR
jgi:hypothetical protein